LLPWPLAFAASVGATAVGPLRRVLIWLVEEDLRVDTALKMGMGAMTCVGFIREVEATSGGC